VFSLFLLLSVGDTSESSRGTSDVLERNAELSTGRDLVALLSTILELEPLLFEIHVHRDENLTEELVLAELLVEDTDICGAGLSSDHEGLLELGLRLLLLLGLLAVHVETHTEVGEKISGKVLAAVDGDLEGPLGRCNIQEGLHLGDEMLIEESGRGLSHGNHVPFGRTHPP